jgi:hypothetical protein
MLQTYTIIKLQTSILTENTTANIRFAAMLPDGRAISTCNAIN